MYGNIMISKKDFCANCSAELKRTLLNKEEAISEIT